MFFKLFYNFMTRHKIICHFMTETIIFHNHNFMHIISSLVNYYFLCKCHLKENPGVYNVMKNSIIDFINGLRSAVLFERHSLERKNRFLQLLCDALWHIWRLNLCRFPECRLSKINKQQLTILLRHLLSWPVFGGDRCAGLRTHNRYFCWRSGRECI